VNQQMVQTYIHGKELSFLIYEVDLMIG